MSKEELVQCFAVVGEILRVTLLWSSKKDVKTRSAFIKFAERDAAARALYLDGFILRGIKIKVMKKLVKDETEEDSKSTFWDNHRVVVRSQDMEENNNNQDERSGICDIQFTSADIKLAQRHRQEPHIYGPRKASLTPGQGGVKDSVKKPVRSKENLSVNKLIAKSKDYSKSASKKKSVVKVLGEQVLSSVKSKIITSTPPAVGIEVQVKWADSTTYTATVVKMEEEECLVHYKGWNKKHYEWIEISPRRGRKRTAFTELKIDHKSNMGKLNAIKSIKTDVDASEGVVGSDNSEKGSDDDEDPEMAGLCEYEKIRLRNIREREAMFEELKISEAKSDLGQMFTPASQNKQGPSKRGLASKKKEKEILPPRKSSRISGGLVPEIQRYEPLLSDPVEEKEVPLHSLPLADTFSSSDLVTLKDTQEVPTELPPLSQEMQEVINRAEGSGEEEILVDAHKIQITVKDIKGSGVAK